MTDILPSMNPDNFTVSLRIRHPTIDPAEITQTLGIEPQHSWKAGESRRAAQGQRVEGSYRESYWIGEFRELDAGLRGVVATEAVLLQAVVLLRRSQPFLTRLQSEGATVELFVEVVGSTEFTLGLSPQLLKLLSKAGLAVVLNVHAEAQALERRKTG